MLLNGAERAAHRDGGKLSFCIFRNIHIGGKLDAVAIMEGDFAVIDKLGLRECLVPFLRKIQGAHILVFV